MTQSRQNNESVEFWLTSDVSYDQLEKFWNGLSRHARQELLRVDKQTFLERVHKNMFCSKCHGFLVEELSQITMYRKSSQQERDVGHFSCVDPWGCLTTTRDGTLTLLDCYVSSTSLKGIQNVFDYSRTREKERKLLYPNSCGVGGRRWKGPRTRETCAVHTVPLPIENLVGFWLSEGEESRQSLFKMKEEDFIELLLFRLDNRKFCRYCRQNVLREFKEIKEPRSIRKESGIQYEISHDRVQADWSHKFVETDGSYHHFEWGIGTAKGKSDISAFKNVGQSKIVHVEGLDLSCLDACYITLRAWRTDEDCTELSVKASTLKGQKYAHCRLLVGDGFVTVTEGESIQNFFKHAEDVVKEDNNLVDENGNRLVGKCSSPQGHASSPELARKFLLDSATVFFKEQVEKAFRESRARQNAHSVFVSLALNMLEERAHVACKEMPTLENQIKILEEEEKEKNERKERKERRRIKEKEKKLRRKERSKTEKSRDNCSLPKQHLVPEVNIKESTIVSMEPYAIETSKVMSSRPVSPHIQNEHQIDWYMRKNMQNSSDVSPDKNFASSNNKNGSSGSDQQDTISKCSISKQYALVPGSGIMADKSDQSYHDDHIDTSSRTTSNQNKHSGSTKSISRAGDLSKPSSFENKFTVGDYMHDSRGRPLLNFVAGNNPTSRDSPQTEEVGEPTVLQMKSIRSYSDSDDTGRLSTLSGDAMKPSEPLETPGALCHGVGGQKTVCIKDKDDVKKELKSSKPDTENNSHSGFHHKKETCYSTGTRNPSINNTSSNNSCSSYLSEGNNSGPSSSTQVIEPLSTSKSKGSSKQSVGRKASQPLQIWVRKSEVVMDKKQIANGGEPTRNCSLDKKRIYTPAKVSKENGNASSDLSQAENKGFSFFHFSGLLAFSDAYKSDSLPSEDAVGGRNKGASLEEYKLFASNKVISFSILGL